MDRQQRALVLAGACVVLTVLGGFAMSWFRIRNGATVDTVDLRGVTTCVDGACQRSGLDATGLFGDNALMTLWGSVIFALVVGLLVGGRRLRGIPSAKWTKKAYFWGVTICGTVLTTAYVFEPDAPHGAALHHTAGPLVLAVGQIAGLVAIYLANDSGYDDDVGTYQPVVIAKVPGVAPRGTPGATTKPMT